MNPHKEPVLSSNPGTDRIFFVRLVWILVPTITILSFLPRRDKLQLHTEGRFHYLGHFLIFGIVAYVAAKVGRTLRERILLFLGALIFGFGIELGEHLAFGSALEWNDVLIDAAGVVAGTLIAIASTQSQTSSRRG